jgi:restriction system protein
LLRVHISNNFLNEDKVITARTQYELDQKIRHQRQRWELKEKKVKEQKYLANMKQKALDDTVAALALINQFQNLLKFSLKQQHQLNWEDMYCCRKFNKPEPMLNTYVELVGVPREDKILEFLFSSLQSKRLEKYKEAERLYFEAFTEYQNVKNEFLNTQREVNQSVTHFRQSYEMAESAFVERHFREVLDRSSYPVGIEKNFEIQYLPETKILIIHFDLPHPESIPRIIEYKFIQTRRETSYKSMKSKEFDEYYEDVLHQIALRTAYEVFQADYVNTIEMVVFNGWIHGVDTSTGLDFHSCIISFQCGKEQLLSFNLEKIVPKDCFRRLRGLSAGPLYQLAPIRPILEINREDCRFVESKKILAEMNSVPNLVDMSWEDFEHLIRELFELHFADRGAEVKVTRKSRDGGVDVIAIDPDPIKGGKYIVQVKKYTHTVPVSAIRELNGVMADEGANRGILVTTSDFGGDSWEFVKGKPLQLVNGPNLKQLFNDYGYKVRIDLGKTKA